MADLSKIPPLGLNRLGAVQMKEKLDSGELTSEAIVLDCLERIKARDDRIGAWKFIDADYACLLYTSDAADE